MGGGNFGRGASFAAAPATGGGFAATAANRGAFAANRGAFAPGTGAVAAAGTPGWNGGNWRGGNWHGGRFHHGHFFPGAAFAAGVALGGAYAYGPDYYYDYGPDYAYSDYGYDDTGVAVTTETGVDPSYCAQRYRSYDPASGTYLGYDGLRHPCP
ncbi:BA14K family protein [Bradyrhizobium sp.]